MVVSGSVILTKLSQFSNALFEKEYVEEPEQTPWITAQSQGNQKKIAHRL